MYLGTGIKWLIIEILAKRFPLKIHQISYYLISDYQKKVSSQAIHKALHELMQRNIILKKERTYQLKTDYIIELDAFVQVMKNCYFFKPVQTYAVGANAKKLFTVDSIVSLDKLWNDILNQKLEEHPIESQIFVQHFPHAWFNLIHMGDEIRIVKKIVDQCKGFYTLVNGSTVLDEWIGKFYSGKKMYYKMREKPITKEREHCYGVIGDYILETVYPKDVAYRLDRLFEASKNMQELEVPELLSIVHEPMTTTLILHHNKKKAETLRHTIQKEFVKK